MEKSFVLRKNCGERCGGEKETGRSALADRPVGTGARLFQGLQLFQPKDGHGVRWHPPVAPGREGDGAHLGPVRQTGALELLVEKAAVEGFFPLQDGGPVIAPAKGMLGKAQHFSGREGPANGIVEEKVVELIGAYQILGLLRDLTVDGG